MAFMDIKNRLLNFWNRTAADSARRPDGGTSFYRPVGKKKKEAEAPTPVQGQDPAYIHTGFTGMNPPSDLYGYPGGGAYGAPPAYGQGGYGDPTCGQGTYGQPTYGQPTYGQPTYNGQGAFGQPAGGKAAWEPTAPRPEQGWFGGKQEPRNNISYMPGYSPDNGSSFTHVEHIMVMTSLKTCYEAIECMKNGETLIVTMDAIANENESLRCQDMLAGAAFTLGCSVRLLQGGRVVVIAPENVKVLPEERERVEMPMRSFVPQIPQPDQAQEAAPRRERRVSANPDWNAARRGERPDFNPYTGTMPAAAGAYAAFGGYGS